MCPVGAKLYTPPALTAKWITEQYQMVGAVAIVILMEVPTHAYKKVIPYILTESYHLEC